MYLSRCTTAVAERVPGAAEAAFEAETHTMRSHAVLIGGSSVYAPQTPGHVQHTDFAHRPPPPKAPITTLTLTPSPSTQLAAGKCTHPSATNVAVHCCMMAC